MENSWGKRIGNLRGKNLRDGNEKLSVKHDEIQKAQEKPTDCPPQPSKLWVELEEGLEVMIVPGGMVLRSSSEVSESMEFVPGKPDKLADWVKETLSSKG